MSDGPHKSLPMRRAWKRMAECADKSAYDIEQIQEALAPALAGDWMHEVPAGVLGGVRRILEDALQGSLFANDAATKLEDLRSASAIGLPMSQLLIDNAIRVSSEGFGGEEALVLATKLTLHEGANRRAWQVEEHYQREATTRRSLRVRERLNEAIEGTSFDALASAVLGSNVAAAAKPPAKRSGLDDGVSLR